MNKNDLIKEVAKNAQVKREVARAVVEAVIEKISDVLSQGDSVRIFDFGTFEVKNCSERIGRNPLTGEKIVIQQRKVPKFIAAKKLKDKINLLANISS